jgi:phenylacetate-CoA ligase
MKSLKEFALLTIIFPLADKVMGTCATAWYKKIKNMNTWTPEQVEKWQWSEMQKFLQHAYDHTVYYKRIFDNLHLKPQDIRCLGDLQQLPTINREIVLKHFDELVPDNIHTMKYRKGKTGGSTGDPMPYYCNEDVWGYVTANKIVSWKAVGYRYGEDFVALGSSSLFPFGKKSPIHTIYNKMRSGTPLNGMNLTNEICAEYVEIIKKKKIRYLYGYAASVYLLSKYIKENNIDLKKQIKACFTTSEMLTDEYRKLIGDTYDCPVMDCYGARDAGISAYEVKPGNFFVGYNVIAEVKNPFAENTGTLLTTNFINYAFPLIRYEFGDEAHLTKDTSIYNGQLIKKVYGRTSDIIRLDNGNTLTGPGFTIFMRAFDIIAYEIKQLSGLEVELKLQVDKEKYSKEQEDKILLTMEKFAGKECKVNIVYVEKFEPLKNGKRRYFMS